MAVDGLEEDLKIKTSLCAADFSQKFFGFLFNIKAYWENKKSKMKKKKRINIALMIPVLEV